MARRERTFREKYGRRRDADPDVATPEARAWTAFRKLLELQPREAGETPQYLRDVIEAEGFTAWHLAWRIMAIRRPAFGEGDTWAEDRAHLLTTPGVPRGQRSRDRQPGEDG